VKKQINHDIIIKHNESIICIFFCDYISRLGDDENRAVNSAKENVSRETIIKLLDK